MFLKSNQEDYININNYRYSHKNLEVGVWDGTELIGKENMIKVIFIKHQSKICLQMFPYQWNYIYFWEDENTLKLNDSSYEKYHFDIEFDSESGELLETTKFKIRVQE